MGLDMYLNGHKWLPRNWDDPKSDRREDGRRVREVIVELGYWRKHPDLHGYIVNTFADGRDECQNIELGADQIRKVIAAVKSGKLPHTAGPFFGTSDGSERNDDVRIFEDALAWVEGAEPPPAPTSVTHLEKATLMQFEFSTTRLPRETRYVVYRASW